MLKNEWKKLLPGVAATAGMIVFSWILFFLARQSQYGLFRLGGIFFLLLGVIQLILLLFRSEFSPPEAEKMQDDIGKPQESEAEKNSNAAKRSVTDDGKPSPLKRWKKIRRHVPRSSQTMRRSAARLGRKIYRPTEILLLLVSLIGGAIWFGAAAANSTAAEQLSYGHLILLVALFVGTVVLDKLCKHTEATDSFTVMYLRNARAFFTIVRLVLVLILASLTLKLLNLTDIQRYVTYVFLALFYYVAVMSLLSLTVRAIKKELATAPGIVILLPFFNADVKELSVISFLEENTGITLRSLWSIKYVKTLIPYSVVGLALLLWGSTGIVYVQSHQEAAVYRLGTLQEELLEPGLHLRMPYPLEKAEVYDTQTVNKLTIGYKSTENADNVWTEAHGDSEYRLLLGSGNELVSINLRVEYRISDLKQYLSSASNPEKILEGKAYELVTERTINSDLDAMLSTDRESFVQSFRQDLSEDLGQIQTGLSVVSVILESIHPPVEVAEVYQNFIGAEIDAERLILNAEASAAVKVARAEAEYLTVISAAKVDYYQRVADANVEIAEFMAAVEASDTYPDEYKYYKYLEAISTAYGQSKLVIVGPGVDTSRLYFGNLNGING